MFKLTFVKHLLLASIIVFVGCSGNQNLVSVLVENPAGNVELIYRKLQSPENMVKEVRYYPSGDTLSVTPMKDGTVHGLVQHYHPKNIVKEQITFVEGKQNGVFKKFDLDGVIVFEGSLIEGRKNGIWTTWYDEVQMEEQRSYLNDQANGKWTYWYIDGSLKREETYELGKLIEEKNFD